MKHLNSFIVAVLVSLGWIAFILLMFTLASPANAATYEFKYKENTTVKVNASDKYQGFKLAAKICYRTLTKNVYPGEERGLDVIDICSNPNNYETAEVK
jgi:hypothetical protein